MMAFDANSLKVEAIPFRNFKERIKIIKQEEKQGRKVEYDDKYVYSFPGKYKKSKHVFKNGRGSRTFENFKCNSCNTKFRITALKDIQWAVCIRCGGVNIDKLVGKEEMNFENKIG